MSNWKLALFCLAGLALLPLTALLAVLSALCGDAVPLAALRGKSDEPLDGATPEC